MIIHEAIVINVREADDLKIAQHFSAGKRRVPRTEPVKRATEKTEDGRIHSASVIRFADFTWYRSGSTC